MITRPRLPLFQAGLSLVLLLVARPGPAAEPSVPAAPPAKQLPATDLPSALPELPADGYWIQDAPINEVFQYLARRSNLQFFHNNELQGTPEYMVTGHLKLDDPRQQMEDLAIAYGLTLYERGATIHAMTEKQLAKLPVEVMAYPLKYLRGARPSSGAKSTEGGGEGGGGGGAAAAGAGVEDFEKIKLIIKPLLTPQTGFIEFEEKTNVLLITDNSVKLEKVSKLLEQIDQPKQQVVINVRILRVRKSRGSAAGVDWSSALGAGAGEGLSFSAQQSLNALFNLPDSSALTRTLGAATTGTNTYTGGTGLVFAPLQVGAILHALNERDLVTQEACPTIITEDNEQGVISIVDRFPIITTQTNATSGGTTVTNVVRYKIDEEDPNAAQEPENSREIGVTLSVTPTILPDGTIRMKLRPRVAKIVELVTGGGTSINAYPRVSESTVEGISRIPSGKSLILGGFYDSNDSVGKKKVPILGSIPLLGKLFQYSNKSDEQISLVFIITPKIYDAQQDPNTINAKVQIDSGFNRRNPAGLGTPLLPAPMPQNDFLPYPVTEPSGRPR